MEVPFWSFFGVQRPVTFSCDASPTGLGGVLLQDNCPVAYAPRSLTDAESGYAQIEKELLLGSSVQPGANQPVRVWKDSARRIRSQTHRNHWEEALSDSTTQTTKNSAQNAKERLHTRIQFKPSSLKTQTWRKTRGNSQRRVADTPQWNHQTWMARNKRLSQ